MNSTIGGNHATHFFCHCWRQKSVDKNASLSSSANGPLVWTNLLTVFLVTYLVTVFNNRNLSIRVLLQEPNQVSSLNWYSLHHVCNNLLTKTLIQFSMDTNERHLALSLIALKKKNWVQCQPPLTYLGQMRQKHVSRNRYWSTTGGDIKNTYELSLELKSIITHKDDSVLVTKPNGNCVDCVYVV